MDLLHDADAVLRTNRNWAGKMAVMPKKNVDVGILIDGMERGEGSGLSALKMSLGLNRPRRSTLTISPPSSSGHGEMTKMVAVGIVGQLVASHAYIERF